MSQNKSSGQKFIARNRAPRVQIEYDVELYGSEKKNRAALYYGRNGRFGRKAGRAITGIGRTQIFGN